MVRDAGKIDGTKCSPNARRKPNRYNSKKGRAVLEWSMSKHINISEWLSQSLDLNSIRNRWQTLKNQWSQFLPNNNYFAYKVGDTNSDSRGPNSVKMDTKKLRTATAVKDSFTKYFPRGLNRNTDHTS